MFVWAFLDKTFGPGYETLSKAAWINGGSPTGGFLSHAPKGPFARFYNNIAGAAWADWLFMAALAGIGIALTLGITMRIAAAVGATLLVMTALFFAAHLPISEPTARFPVQYDAIPAVAAYRLVFLGAIGLTLCRLFLLWRRVSVAAAASGRATQRQARLQTVVWALGAAYCGYECGYILLRAIGVATPMLYSTVLAYGLLAGCFALILNDGFVTVVQWMDRYRAYHELDPLWRAFVTAFPDLALDSPHRSSMLVTVFGDLNFQLRRRVTEIRDGIMTLQPFLDRMARDEARKYCHAFTGARLSVPQDVEALTLAAALAAKQQGQRAQNRLAEPYCRTQPVSIRTCDICAPLRRHTAVYRRRISWQSHHQTLIHERMQRGE